MRKVLIALTAIALIAANAHAAVVPTRVSGNTIRLSNDIEDNIVTFNSATKHIFILNESLTDDVQVDLRCYNTADRRTGHSVTDSCTVLLPAVGGASPNTVELDFATDNLGFTTEAAHNTVWISYWVTGERGDL